MTNQQFNCIEEHFDYTNWQFNPVEEHFDYTNSIINSLIMSKNALITQINTITG